MFLKLFPFILKRFWFSFVYIIPSRSGCNIHYGVSASFLVIAINSVLHLALFYGLHIITHLYFAMLGLFSSIQLHYQMRAYQ
jgi:hypothetical protein